MAAKILLLDIETAPSVGYVWGKYDQNVIEFERDWYMLSFAYKWLDKAGVTVKAIPDYKGYTKDVQDDGNLIKDLWEVLNAADIVVAHNGDSFDIKKSNARFLTHGLPPPASYKTVDTLKIARKHFRFDSNKLGDLGEYLGVGGKMPHIGFAIWRGCMQNDPKSWQVMKDYNAQDITLLEAIYLRLRPWASHPDVNLYSDDAGKGHCPSCGSGHVQRRGKVIAKTRAYQRWNCQGCGAWFQGDIIKNG
jgi:DNA polymerase elongation subunit (family B)